MIDGEDFAIRLQKIMDHYELSASAFAEKVSVPRSSISHLLSGRNKPSLDFVLKVTTTFQEVNLYWLLHGQNSFPSQSINTNQNKTPSAEIEGSEISSKKKQLPKKIIKDSSIERIIIFYKDGRFDEYQN